MELSSLLDLTLTSLRYFYISTLANREYSDVRTKTYATEYRIETLSPAYTKKARPTLGGVPKNILYGKTSTVTVKWPAGTAQKDISIVLMDL